MNSKAKEIGCTGTHFLNANGMHDDNHYTTAQDLAKMAVYGMKNEEFRKIVSTVEYKLPTTSLYPKDDRVMKNTNLLIHPESQYYYSYTIGVKTGYTKQAGNCLVSYAEKDGVRLVCVTLKAGSTTDQSSYRFADSKRLLEYGFENFSNREIIKEGQIIDTIQVTNGTKDTKYLKIVTKDSTSDFIANSIDIDGLEADVQLKEEILAPIHKGDVLGKISYTIDDISYTSELVADSDVQKDTSYIYFIIIVGGVLLFSAGVVLIVKKR
ncbi:MAG: D-alanyl-D-alanine carboxypeptidase [Clostridia bacterium]|nr:D-alanyl-D-alanine carboxypeptidase [Clostridia bacterium]